MLLRYIFLFGIIFFSISCSDKNENLQQEIIDEIELNFSLIVNEEIYTKTDFGEAPQIAIWLEEDSSFLKTVWVTERAGKNDWVGKVKCTIALPIWESKKIEEQKSSFWKRVVDAVTGATVPRGKINAKTFVPKDKKYYYYIEVNASGDYNEKFSYWSEDSKPDTEGNGQPSIIYKGEIAAKENIHSTPKLFGRSEQRKVVNLINQDTLGLTTAKLLISSIEVKTN